MNAIQLDNCEIGTVSSRADGSVAFRVITAELRHSECGAVMAFHGKAAKVIVAPHADEPGELVKVTTEREGKPPSQRLRGVIFKLWQQAGSDGGFDSYYTNRMEHIINKLKEQLDQ
jgi:hypothetical protein